MSRTVDYRSVINRLTDAIKELNQPHAKDTKDPKESAKRAMDERRRDAAKLLRALLRALEQKPVASGAAAAAAGAAAAAAAERSAGALRGSEASPEQQSLAFWAWVREVETNGLPDPAEFYELAASGGFNKTHAKTLYDIFYPSDENGGKCVVNRADLLYSVQGLLGALDTANTALATSQATLRNVATSLARLWLGHNVYSGPQLSALSCYERNTYDALIDILMSGRFDVDELDRITRFYVSTTSPTDMTMSLTTRMQNYLGEREDFDNLALFILPRILYLRCS
jgi:hypothetical protein